jgi:hypothetical protein
MGGETATMAMQILSLVVVACSIFLLNSFLSSLVFLAHSQFIFKAHEHIKSKLLIFHALCAICASLAVIVWLSIARPPLFSLIYQHCHGNNCNSHIPSIIDVSLISSLFVLFAMCMFALCFILVKVHRKKLEVQINSLLQLSQNKPYTKSDYLQATVIDTPQAVLLNVGLIRPKLLLSSQLVDSLHSSDINLLLAYEYVKSKRYENLKVKLARIACMLWPKNIRQLLVLGLRDQAREQAYKEMSPLLDKYQTQIPHRVLDNMTWDMQEFVSKINTDHQSNYKNDGIGFKKPRIATKYFALSCYFLCLVVVTSNLLHFALELIGQ